VQTPYVIIDLDTVETKFRELSEALHSTELCYAVKANPGKPVIERLAALGASFDVASVPEIDLVLSCGVEPARISFGNTIKKQRDIAYAAQQGITRFTVDTLSELHKVLAEAPRAEVCVRLFHDCEGADCAVVEKIWLWFFRCKKYSHCCWQRWLHNRYFISRGLATTQPRCVACTITTVPATHY